MEKEVYDNLTRTKKGSDVLHITAGPDAAELDAVIGDEMERTRENKSEVVRRLLINTVKETRAQARNAHALEILGAPFSLPYTLDELADRLADIKKALLGWPIINEVKFVRKDSPEYKAWIEEQESAS